MADLTDKQISSMQGPEALPRRNGELVFEQPWESRAFGLAVGLSEAGVLTWPEFQEALVSAIRESDKSKDGRTYYERWASALEGVALGRGLVTEESLRGRMKWLEEESGHGR